MTWPTELSINAWTGESPAIGNVPARARDWSFVKEPPKVEKYLKVPRDPNPANWRHPGVGWGLILPDRSGLSPADLASGADAPEPIRALLQNRGNAPVFRYLPQLGFRHLRNYASMKDIFIDPRTKRGIGPEALPRYLLIYGGPKEIPWGLQYKLNATYTFMAGRLDLEGEALENYVKALLNNWKDASSLIDQAVVWAVVHGTNDITRLMRNSIAEKIYLKWIEDSTLKDKATFLDGAKTPASAATLIETLSKNKPALVVTTSHGQTGPLDDLTVMKSKLGLPVDQAFQPLGLDQLLQAWEPDGAIWYAHACCSAGSSNITIFKGLVETDSIIDRVLKGVTKLGALVAPLPRALLGAKKPLRAFIGHIEPTFDWTLRQSNTGQHLTNSLLRVLYNNVYNKKPIGLAFRECYESLGSLYTDYVDARDASERKENTREIALYSNLTARDLQSMVILGDPTVMLPPLP